MWKHWNENRETIHDNVSIWRSHIARAHTHTHTHTHRSCNVIFIEFRSLTIDRKISSNGGVCGSDQMNALPIDVSIDEINRRLCVRLATNRLLVHQLSSQRQWMFELSSLSSSSSPSSLSLSPLSSPQQRYAISNMNMNVIVKININNWQTISTHNFKLSKQYWMNFVQHLSMIHRSDVACAVEFRIVDLAFDKCTHRRWLSSSARHLCAQLVIVALFSFVSCLPVHHFALKDGTSMRGPFALTRFHFGFDLNGVSTNNAVSIASNPHSTHTNSLLKSCIVDADNGEN